MSSKTPQELTSHVSELIKEAQKRASKPDTYYVWVELIKILDEKGIRYNSQAGYRVLNGEFDAYAFTHSSGQGCFIP